MIEITDKRDCCGCYACVQRCPKHCIEMTTDHEGFWYPCVDKDKCVDCKLCEKICPHINENEEKRPLATYAVKHPDKDILLASSSGGAFTLMAEWIISNGGVVFGARFDNDWNVVHGYVETMDGLAALRMSKYVQSKIGQSFKDAERFLKEERYVMFVGTPCQVHGLRLYLRKNYKKLLTVDFVCHGVPSPKVWQTYLSEEVARQCDKNSVSLPPNHSLSERDALIEGISFRNKRLGWEKFSFALSLSKATAAGEKNSVSLSKSLNDCAYLRGFIHDIYLRPSCYACKNKSFKSGSDITLADFWGIKHTYPSIYDSNGVSCLTVNTEHGRDLFSQMHIASEEVDFEKALQYNPSFLRSVKMHRFRKLFFRLYYKMPFTPLVLGIQIINKLCKIAQKR